MLRLRVVGKCHGLLPLKAFSQGCCSCLGLPLSSTSTLCTLNIWTSLCLRLMWCMSEEKKPKQTRTPASRDIFFWCLEGNVHVSGTAQRNHSGKKINLDLETIMRSHSIRSWINTLNYLEMWGCKGHLGLRPAPCHSQPLSDKPSHKLISWSILEQIRSFTTITPTGGLFKSLTYLLLWNIFLIFSLNLFMASLYPFVLVPVLSFSLNSSVSSLIVFLDVFIDNIHIPSGLLFH